MSKIKLLCGDCIDIMKKIKDNQISINTIITSPPYNVDLGNNKNKKEGYNVYNDNIPYSDYLKWMKEVFTICYDILEEDGRICINIGDGKNGSISTHSDFISILKEIGFIQLSTIIWNKNTISCRTAWGSFMSASAPSFPTQFEYILIFGKTKKLIHKGESTVTKEEFIKYSNSLWVFSPEKNQKKLGHPAMFPVELPSRLIKMLTYKGDNILDPFSGIATTGIACLNTGRNYYGIEIDKKYHSIAIERIKNEINLLKK